MPKNNQKKQDTGKKELSSSPESIQEEARPDGEKSSPENGQNLPDLSDDLHSEGSVPHEKESEDKIEIDLEGLERLASPAKTTSDLPGLQKEPQEKVELDLDGIDFGTPATGSEPHSLSSKEREKEPKPGVDEPEEEPVAPRPKPPRPAFSIKKPLKLALTGTVMIALLNAVFLFFYHPAKTPKKDTQQGSDSPQLVSPKKSSPPSRPVSAYHSYRLAPFFVPISLEQLGREGFLKVSISLAFRDSVPSDEIKRKLLIIRSKITEMLLDKTISDIQFGEGKIAIKREIKDLLNASLTEGTVQIVYFEEFFIL
jgi:flagellar basal body-associated protein FliL